MLFLPGQDSDFDLTEEEEEDYESLVTLANDVAPIKDSNIGVIFVNELLSDYDNTDEVETAG